MRNVFPSFMHGKLHLHLGHRHDALDDRSQVRDTTCPAGSGTIISSSPPLESRRSHAHSRKRIPSAWASSTCWYGCTECKVSRLLVELYLIIFFHSSDLFPLIDNLSMGNVEVSFLVLFPFSLSVSVCIDCGISCLRRMLRVGSDGAARISEDMGVSGWDVLGFVRDLLHLVPVVPADPRFACVASAKVGQGSPWGVHGAGDGRRL